MFGVRWLDYVANTFIAAMERKKSTTTQEKRKLQFYATTLKLICISCCVRRTMLEYGKICWHRGDSSAVSDNGVFVRERERKGGKETRRTHRSNEITLSNLLSQFELVVVVASIPVFVQSTPLCSQLPLAFIKCILLEAIKRTAVCSRYDSKGDHFAHHWIITDAQLIKPNG